MVLDQYYPSVIMRGVQLLNDEDKMQLRSVTLLSHRKHASKIQKLKGHSRLSLTQQSADLHKDHRCYHVNIFEVKQLADDVIILKLIVTSSYGEVSGPCA